jgi:hypothetical protein
MYLLQPLILAVVAFAAYWAGTAIGKHLRQKGK